VSNFKVSFEVKEGNADFTAGISKIAFKSIDFTLPQVSIQSDNIAFKEHDHTAELNTWLQTRLSDALHTLKKDAFAGRDSVIGKLPALSIAPLVGLYFAAYGADKMQFTDEFIEYEFSPVSLKIVKEANLHEEFIQAIETDFAQREEGEEASALQLIID
jgi:hypothetical protein